MIRRAFSLVELLMVMAILAVLMGLISVGIGNWLNVRKIGGAAADVAAQLRGARAYAIEHNKVIHVRFIHSGEDAQRVEVYELPNARSCLSAVAAWPTEDDNRQVMQTVRLPVGIRFDPDANPAGSVTADYTPMAQQLGSIYFWPDGSAGNTTKAGERVPNPFYLADELENQRRITVALATGGIDIENPKTE